MNKLLFFDIDGTLIECNLGIYSIPDKLRQDLDQLKVNGHDVFFGDRTAVSVLLQMVLWIILLMGM